MPSGAIHGKITMALTPAVVVATASVTQSIPYSLCAGTGCLLGLIIEPDLDVDHITQSEGRVIRKLGCIGYAYASLWMIYALAIPHRSWVSHLPPFGTIFRTVYLLAWILPIYAILLYAFGGVFERLALWVLSNLDYFLAGWVGLLASDTAHFIADTIT